MKINEYSVIRCNFLKCSAGMGVAGNLTCCRHGDYTNPDCPRFQDEDTFLKEWELEEKNESDTGIK
jgi:hypothetical protein